MDKIGLFPLGIVLFPESSYPLHIFEERYKKLINTCIEEKTVFGINYTDQAKMSDVGCTAYVSDIMKKYDDGRMDILVTGKERYRMIRFSEGDKPYYTADIEYFNDDSEIREQILVNDTVKIFNDIAKRIKYVNIEPIDIDKIDNHYLSFLMAQKSGMDAKQKQNLLEMKSENERLKILRNHLRRLKPLIKEAESITKIVMNDGYYKPGFTQ